MTASGAVWTLFLIKSQVIAVCAASSDHGVTKTKSHGIMQLRRNREGLQRSLSSS